MPDKLGLIICSTYYQQLKEIMTDFEEDVMIFSFPSTCAAPAQADLSKIDEGLSNLERQCSKIIALSSSDCIGQRKHPKLSIFGDSPIKSCIGLFLPEDRINKLIKEGKYIMEANWVNHWERIIKTRWGFDQNTAKDFLGSLLNPY
jgi:hypothetical protein